MVEGMQVMARTRRWGMVKGSECFRPGWTNDFGSGLVRPEATADGV